MSGLSDLIDYGVVGLPPVGMPAPATLITADRIYAPD